MLIAKTGNLFFLGDSKHNGCAARRGILKSAGPAELEDGSRAKVLPKSKDKTQLHKRRVDCSGRGRIDKEVLQHYGVVKTVAHGIATVDDIFACRAIIGL